MRSKDPATDGALPRRARTLMKAIVDAALARGDGSADRERVLAEAEEEFRRIAQLQAEAAALIRRQRRLLADQAGRLIVLEEQLREVKRLLGKRERRLANARETILNYDGEIERLTAQVRADADLIEELRAAQRPRGGRRGGTSRAGATGRGDPADGAASSPPRSGIHPMSARRGRP